MSNTVAAMSLADKTNGGSVSSKTRNLIAAGVVVAVTAFWLVGPGGLGSPSVSPSRKGMSIMTSSSSDAAKRKDAAELFNKALLSDGSDPIALFGLGWAEQLDGNNAQAKEHYAKAINELQNTLNAARFNQSLVLEQQGDLRAAYEELRLLLRVDPNNEGARTRQSTLIQKMGQQQN